MSNPEAGLTIAGQTASLGGSFPTTRWTLVLAAGHNRDASSSDALASLCEAYWYPVYAFLRRSGRNAETSQDITQSFFLRLLEGSFFSKADPVRGRFRSFLMGSLRHFLADEADHRLAQKRGGGAIHLPFDPQDGENRYRHEPSTTETPERIFERRWALAVLDRTMKLIENDFLRGGRLDHFQHLRPYLTGQGEAPYAALAEKLGVSESSVKSGIHRLRKRYREALRAEVASTVAEEQEIDAELRYLIQSLAAPRA